MRGDRPSLAEVRSAFRDAYRAWQSHDVHVARGDYVFTVEVGETEAMTMLAVFDAAAMAEDSVPPLWCGEVPTSEAVVQLADLVGRWTS